MRVAQLDYADPAFPVSLVDRDPHPLPGPDWARVRVTGGGICGSDLHLFDPTTGPTPQLLAYVALPMELGHEISGVVTEAGPEVTMSVGTRVAVDPVVGCLARGIEPRCPACRAGATASCHQLGSHRTTAGMMLGYSNDLGGGWSEEVLAHRSMLHAVPDAVPDRAIVLHEPLSIAVHGLLRRPPRPGDPVLVVGAGVIGLCVVAALRALFPDNPVTVVARHPHQHEVAARLGAAHLVTPTDDGSHRHTLAEQAGTTVVGTLLAGGFPYVVEAVGTPTSIADCLASVAGGGSVLFLGATGMTEVDLTALWFKEVTVAGSFCHACDPPAGRAASLAAPFVDEPVTAPADEPRVHSIDVALGILATGGLPAELLITHEFPLDEVRAAVTTALDRRGTGAIKVVLRP
jgi:threonine dehydrogenase-like Zn-dependent dehydrogenase